MKENIGMINMIPDQSGTVLNTACPSIKRIIVEKNLGITNAVIFWMCIFRVLLLIMLSAYHNFVNFLLIKGYDKFNLTKKELLWMH